MMSLNIFAQTKITGRVTDTNNKGIADVIIKLTKENSNKTLAYSTSNPKGQYTLEVKNVQTGTALLPCSRQVYILGKETFEG